MTITQALQLASTEHVLRFLLTAYIETFHYYEDTRAGLHPTIIRLPIAGRTDMARRLGRLYRMVRETRGIHPGLQPVVGEAIEVFTLALRRLHDLTPDPARREAAEAVTEAVSNGGSS